MPTDKKRELPLAFTKRVKVTEETTTATHANPLRPKRQAGTKTFTRVAKENTDSD